MTAEFDAMADILINGIENGSGHLVELESLNVAVLALEKQIPKSVKRVQRYWRTGNPSYKDYYCPVCSKQQKRGKNDGWYCERCGQKLTWEVSNG